MPQSTVRHLGPRAPHLCSGSWHSPLWGRRADSRCDLEQDSEMVRRRRGYERNGRLRGGAALCLALLLAATAAGFDCRSVDRRGGTCDSPPAIDEPAGQPATPEVAVVAGGCFWGVQGVFQHVAGRHQRRLRLCRRRGGDGAVPDCERRRDRSRGIGQDHLRPEPDQLRPHPADLLLRRPRPDAAAIARAPTSARSTARRLFTTGPEQERIAKAYIAQLDQAHVYDRAIVTRIEPDRTFYPAEDYHQDFLTLNPTYPYIAPTICRRSKRWSSFSRTSTAPNRSWFPAGSVSN